MRLYKLNRLLDGSRESAYWLGFLLADGHFSASGRLVVTLADKDTEHLKNLSTFLGVSLRTDAKRQTATVAVMDTATVQHLKEKYSISNKKSVSPPDLSVCSEEELRCMAIGFIDGDGHICKQTGRRGGFIGIKVHKAWLDILKTLFPTAKVGVNAKGYARAFISKHADCVALKLVANSLPSLKRKWGEIDEMFVSRVDIAAERFIIAKGLKEAGKSNKDIASALGISKGGVTQLFKRNNYEY